jgi:hypothetical protein
MSTMTPASQSLTGPRNQIPAQPKASASADGRLRTVGRPIANLPADRDPMLIGLQNLRAAQDKALEPAGSPAA